MNRNASASANGWVFQVATGIYLFLENIKENQSIKIEGEKEDIEIITGTGKKYIQVKSLFNVNSRESVYNHYKKALESLKDADDGKTELVYFSNIRDPFNVNDNNFYDYGTSFEYNDLTENVKEKIKKILGESFNYDKLTVTIVNSYGTEDSKSKFAVNQIERFLIKINESESKARIIFDYLFTRCFYNAAENDICKKISKETFIYYIILPFLNQTINENEFEKMNSIEYYEEINDKYEKYLYSNELRYDVYTRIASDCKKYKFENKSSDNYDFINSYYSNYLNLVPDNFEQHLKEGITKILMYRVLNKRILLSKIKEATGL